MNYLPPLPGDCWTSPDGRKAIVITVQGNDVTIGDAPNAPEPKSLSVEKYRVMCQNAIQIGSTFDRPVADTPGFDDFDTPGFDDPAPAESELPGFDDPAPAESELPGFDDPAPAEPELPSFDDPAPAESELPGFDDTPSFDDPAPAESGLTGSSNTHARLSPSDSKRWTNCTASIAYQEANAHRVPEDTGSRYADEGTEAHEWAAKVLLGHCTIEEVPELGMLGNDLRVHVAAYVEHCLAAADGKPYLVEVEVPLYYQPEQPGTCDFAVISSERIVVRDYKHGAGELVDSASNTQLAIYAMSLIQLKKLTPEPDTIVSIHVFQPRHREAAEQKPWEITFGDLTTFCREIEYQAITARVAADRVREKIGAPGRDVSCDEILEAAPGARFAPSHGACRWCKCRAFCEAKAKVSTDDLDLPGLPAADLLAMMPDLTKEEKKQPVEDRVFTTAEKVGAAPVTDEWLVAFLRRKKAITAWLTDVEDYLQSRLEAGEAIPGVKLVVGREGNREWANEQAAETFLTGQGLKKEDRCTFSLISVAQAEKKLKNSMSARAKKRFEDLVVRAPGKPKITLDTDDREEVGSLVSSLPDLD